MVRRDFDGKDNMPELSPNHPINKAHEQAGLLRLHTLSTSHACWINPPASWFRYCVLRITLYFRRISIVRSSGNAPTVRPFPVMVIARNSEL